MARLIEAVHLTDPQTKRRVVLQPGEEPAPHLAALITNESAWEDGILPELPDTDSGGDPDPEDNDQDRAAGTETAPAPENARDEPEAPAEEKTARKTAARKLAAAQ
ncbi:hypothetical protein ACFY8X_38675 [Streptomyces tanashiensis]|uniref:hypothetical protein n=1 Tax=Streptomyces tanashiensis TaxID=67367 RepID=UPI0036F17A67